MRKGESQKERRHLQERLHASRISELNRRGVIGLIFQVGMEGTMDPDGWGLDLSFKGDPTVRIKASRKKEGDGVLYKEDIGLTYDGKTLSINGRHPVFTAPIPQDDAACEEAVTEAIRAAFDNPVRTIITDYDPRNYY